MRDCSAQSPLYLFLIWGTQNFFTGQLLTAQLRHVPVMTRDHIAAKSAT